MRMQRNYPLTLRFQTHQFLYQFRWQNQDYLTLDVVQVSQPQNTFYGELRSGEEQTNNLIKTVFLHLQQIVNMSFQNEKDYISPSLSIIDASKQFNRVEYKLKVKLFNRQNSEVNIPLVFKFQSSQMLQKQRNRSFYLMKFVIQNRSFNSQQSKYTDQFDQKQDKNNKKKKRKFKLIEKVIRNESKRRQIKKTERKLLSKKRSDNRKLQSITKMFQKVQIK